MPSLDLKKQGRGVTETWTQQYFEEDWSSVPRCNKSATNYDIDGNKLMSYPPSSHIVTPVMPYVNKFQQKTYGKEPYSYIINEPFLSSI